MVRAQTTELRTAPYVDAPISTTLRRDDKVDVNEALDGWRWGRLSDGTVGYVQDAALEVEGEPRLAGGAQEPPAEVGRSRLTSPAILRLDLDVGGESDSWLLPSSENTVGGIAATVGCNFSERLSAELTVGSGIPGAYSPGLKTMAVGRAAVLIGEAHRSALPFAAGPLLIAGGAYDAVVFGHAELGYEYRGSEFTFLFSAGPDLTFNDSLQVRLGVGFAFGG